MFFIPLRISFCASFNAVFGFTRRIGNFAADADVHGVVKVVTVPVCAIGGVLGSTGYILYETVADLFKKGTDVTFNQGDVLTVVLTNDIDIPVN